MKIKRHLHWFLRGADGDFMAALILGALLALPIALVFWFIVWVMTPNQIIDLASGDYIKVDKEISVAEKTFSTDSDLASKALLEYSENLKNRTNLTTARNALKNECDQRVMDGFCHPSYQSHQCYRSKCSTEEQDLLEHVDNLYAAGIDNEEKFDEYMGVYKDPPYTNKSKAAIFGVVVAGIFFLIIMLYFKIDAYKYNKKHYYIVELVEKINSLLREKDCYKVQGVRFDGSRESFDRIVDHGLIQDSMLLAEMRQALRYSASGKSSNKNTDAIRVASNVEQESKKTVDDNLELEVEMETSGKRAVSC